MKFLAIAATACALTLSAQDTGSDIVDWFVKTGSAENFMKLLDTSGDGKINWKEAKKGMLTAGLSQKDANSIGKFIFDSMSQGKKWVTLKQAKGFETGLRAILKSEYCQGTTD